VRLFPNAHHDGLQPTQLRVVWHLHLHADAEGPTFIFTTARRLPVSVSYIRTSQSSSGHTNAAAEAVNSLYKKELINHEGPWQDAGQVTVATAEWVAWYNEDRLHSACGDSPPAEYENTWLTRKGHTIIMPEAKAS
jgi:transposase InsO family protein